jgi:hypothetical protein
MLAHFSSSSSIRSQFWESSAASSCASFMLGRSRVVASRARLTGRLPSFSRISQRTAPHFLAGPASSYYSPPCRIAPRCGSDSQNPPCPKSAPPRSGYCVTIFLCSRPQRSNWSSILRPRTRSGLTIPSNLLGLADEMIEQWTRITVPVGAGDVTSGPLRSSRPFRADAQTV